MIFIIFYTFFQRKFVLFIKQTKNFLKPVVLYYFLSTNLIIFYTYYIIFCIYTAMYLLIYNFWLVYNL